MAATAYPHLDRAAAVGPAGRAPSDARLLSLGLALLVAILLAPHPVWSQSRNQFGRADRADAASQMITLAVQQAISQLPPSEGQAFAYVYDPSLSTYVRDDRLGPTQFISPRTIGEGNLNVRLGLSYFRLEKSFSPVFYRLSSNPAPGSGAGPTPRGFTKFGLEVRADVGVLGLGATYGVLDWLDTFVDVPIVLVNASADQTYAGPVQPIADEDKAFVDLLIQRLGLGRQSLAERGTFGDGTNVGLGRVGLGAKARLFSTADLTVGAVGRVAFASPSSAEFAGSDTFALFPRLVGTFFLRAPVQLYADVGYEADLSSSELSRFVWSSGLSAPLPRASLDIGVGGSLYDTAIRWTPLEAEGDPFMDSNGFFVNGSRLAIDEPSASQLETDFINLLLGGKLKLTEHWVVNAAVSIALTSGGFRPDAVGTLALEAYF